MPNGLGLVAKDGITIVNVCAECVEKIPTDKNILNKLKKMIDGEAEG